MIPFRLQLSWDGSRYYGWQKQPAQPGIQGEIEKAFETVAGAPVKIDGCGRTDRGVHAALYLASGIWPHMSSDASSVVLPPGLLPRLQKILPDDIHLLDICALDKPFHARYDVTARCYVLLMTFAPLLPWELAYRTAVSLTPDTALFAEAAKIFLGTHVFDAFAVADSGHTTIENISVGTTQRGLVLRVTGNRFLRRQVRGMAGMLLAVASGSLPQSALVEALDTGIRPTGWESVSAAGLALQAVACGSQWFEPPQGRGWYNQVGEITWLT